MCLLGEAVISQHAEEFTLIAAVDSATRHTLHVEVAPTRDYLTSWGFFEYVCELYGRVPSIVVTDEASYDPDFTRLGVTRIVRRHSVHNRIERWLQELKHRIETFYASFSGHDLDPTNNRLASSPGREIPA